MAPRQEVIYIHNADIRWPNFSGRADDYNAEGDRNFNLRISAEDAEEMRSRGLNIRPFNDNDPDVEPTFTMKVKVSYKFSTPQVYLIAGGNKGMLGQDQIGMLDQLDLEKVDLGITISPWRNRRTGEIGGYSAYLKEMFATMYLSPLAMEYSHVPDMAITGGATLALPDAETLGDVIEGEFQDVDPRY